MFLPSCLFWFPHITTLEKVRKERKKEEEAAVVQYHYYYCNTIINSSIHFS